MIGDTFAIHHADGRWWTGVGWDDNLLHARMFQGRRQEDDREGPWEVVAALNEELRSVGGVCHVAYVKGLLEGPEPKQRRRPLGKKRAAHLSKKASDLWLAGQGE